MRTPPREENNRHTYIGCLVAKATVAREKKERNRGKIRHMTNMQKSELRPQTTVPERASLEGLEDRWGEHWENDNTYRFNRETTRENVYSIDTPPPTVSGSLHIGHVFSYTHTDTIARFWRMRNSLTRRRAETTWQVRLLPSGLGRQRPAYRASRPKLLRRALRPLPALRRKLHAST